VISGGRDNAVPAFTVSFYKNGYRTRHRKDGMTKLLGMLLVEDEKISTAQLAEALNYQEANGGYLGDILIEKGYLDRETLEEYLRRQKKLRKDA
jgi:hypothetical protein